MYTYSFGALEEENSQWKTIAICFPTSMFLE
jgi:hypothetical protein